MKEGAGRTYAAKFPLIVVTRGTALTSD